MAAKEKKRKGLYLSIIIVILIVFLGGFFVVNLFEGESPSIKTRPLAEYVSGAVSVTIEASDSRRGLRSIRAVVVQNGSEKVLLEKLYPFNGLMNREGTRFMREEIQFDPKRLGLAQGRAVMEIRCRDYSMRSGGDGNLTVLRQETTIDTVPPSVRSISGLHYVNEGGTGFVVYKTSSDTSDSGVSVGSEFYRGFLHPSSKNEGMYECFFPIPYDFKPETQIRLWARDSAGNNAMSPFHCKVRKKKFPSDKMVITDKFLEKILPYFQGRVDFDSTGKLEQFLKINREVRVFNDRTLSEVRSKTAPEHLWEGSWLRLPNAATMARFGDSRTYYYEGKAVDAQVHLGIDLASLANSAVPAANSGKVIIAEELGIYGKTIVLDHGMGVASLYSHLSEIKVSVGQDIKKGDTIGITGQTGLAGGDHLHFAVMVQGVFVNPIEWWDQRWIDENIYKRIALIN
ncbi:MAG: hypothetical protein COZ70_04210 [Deltaproteobacteria bacterium CG_4_8_14_3_um_filter_51_11]|nr:M23 family metallopeptidase [bacterium]OIP41124.1 MAG: hypothetical protein AUK25_06315 [Desulfobacteraceae bacterium CG2_30_51_40]PIP45936.1 MAG: peptidase M23 [Deltaproteobacteria bacterium CG23_combo_of_CG06-09_8_20_14_all_51_20]PIX20321.1 MAG: hypothetical protein COZ70_04210 [Deltaproteobacteria bacterium CG_4_8_14_3_um_filter_51_11]